MTEDRRLKEIRKGISLNAYPVMKDNVYDMTVFLLSEIDRLKARWQKKHDAFQLEMKLKCKLIGEKAELEAKLKEAEQENIFKRYRVQTMAVAKRARKEEADNKSLKKQEEGKE